MSLSEHVYCVAVTFKMTEWVEQWKSASNFALSLNIPPRTLFTWFRRPQLWATGDWQLHHDNVPTHAPHLVQRFLAKHQITQVTATLQPRFGFLWLLTFPKTEITFERRDFRPLMRFRKIWQGSWWQLGELCEVPRCLLWRGLRCHCLMCNISCIFFNKCLYFSYYMAGYLLDRPYICMYIYTYVHVHTYTPAIMGAYRWGKETRWVKLRKEGMHPGSAETQVCPYSC